MKFFLIFLLSTTLTEARTPKLPPMCRIQVTREGKGTAHSQTIRAGVKPTATGAIRPSGQLTDRHTENQGQAVSMLVISSGYSGKIAVDGEEVGVKCHVRGRAYELELQVASTNPKRNTMLSTTVSLAPGTRLEIGGVVRNLKAKDRTLSTSGVGWNKAEEAGQENVYVQVQ